MSSPPDEFARSQRAMLDNELIGWLTTVNSDGQPQSSAIWFMAERQSLVVFSKPDATRMENLRTNPLVAFNLRGDRRGNSILTAEGTIREEVGPTAADEPAYLAKYRSEMERLGWTPAQFADLFSARLRMTIARVRHWS